jgi:hypothetical protein
MGDSDKGLLTIIKSAFSRRDTRLADLEARLAAVEARSLADSWKGIYIDGATYHRGDLTTRSGALWLSLTNDNNDTPAQSPTWKMLSKSHK